MSLFSSVAILASMTISLPDKLVKFCSNCPILRFIVSSLVSIFASFDAKSGTLFWLSVLTSPSSCNILEFVIISLLTNPLRLFSISIIFKLLKVSLFSKVEICESATAKSFPNPSISPSILVSLKFVTVLSSIKLPILFSIENNLAESPSTEFCIKLLTFVSTPSIFDLRIVLVLDRLLILLTASTIFKFIEVSPLSRELILEFINVVWLLILSTSFTNCVTFEPVTILLLIKLPTSVSVFVILTPNATLSLVILLISSSILVIFVVITTSLLFNPSISSPAFVILTFIATISS